MRIKTLVMGAAIALVAGLGPVSAGDQFTTLDGVPAVEMDPGQLASIRGSAFFLAIQKRPIGVDDTPVPDRAVLGPNVPRGAIGLFLVSGFNLGHLEVKAE